MLNYSLRRWSKGRENMTEKNFIGEARKRGLRDENIRRAILNFPKMKTILPNIGLDVIYIESMLKAQAKKDASSDDFITVD